MSSPLPGRSCTNGTAEGAMSELKKEGDTIAVATYGPNPFNATPIEINQSIASYLEDDKDLAAFRRTCRSANDAVNSDNFSFWRRRFLSVFEKPINYRDNLQYKLSYQKRKAVLRLTIKFKRGTSTLEMFCLDVLRDLIAEAWSAPVQGDTKDERYSPNARHLLSFLKGNLSLIRATPESSPRSRRSDTSRSFNPFLLTLQVLAAPWLLHPSPLCELDSRFPACQRTVYAHAEERDIFGPAGTTVDMEWLLHQLGFWQYHMTRPQEYTLQDAFSLLRPDELPRPWSHPLSPIPDGDDDADDADDDADGSGARPLGRRWKGSYAFVDRPSVRAIRAGEGEDDVFQDEFNGEAFGGAFQDLVLDPVGPDRGPDDARARCWPTVFEYHLRSLSFPLHTVVASAASPPSVALQVDAAAAAAAAAPAPPPKTRARHRADEAARGGFRSRSLRFVAHGHDLDEDFLADGWTNGLPPQQGIHGWRRMTMMKYFLVDGGGGGEGGAIDYDTLWAYEGVVLPGGEMVLGRWWSPRDGVGEGMYSGPFILWCVDVGNRS